MDWGGKGTFSLGSWVSTFSHLKKFQYNQRYLDIWLTLEEMIALMGGLSHCPRLETLSFQYIKVDEQALHALTEGVSGCLALQSPYFERAIVTSGKGLSLVLNRCTQLKKLEFFALIMLDKALAECFREVNRTSSLKELSIKSFISNHGAKELAKALHFFPKLKTLALWANDIKMDGFISLVNALKRSSVEVLELVERNELECKDNRILKKAIREKCKHVKRLKLNI